MQVKCKSWSNSYIKKKKVKQCPYVIFYNSLSEKIWIEYNILQFTRHSFGNGQIV